MDIITKLFTNCAHPKGWMGKMVLNMMNFGHAPLTNWGLKLINFQKEWTILDIGCGGGATLKRLLKRSDGAKVYGIDISEESVAKSKKVCKDLLGNRVFVCQGSAQKLPYDSDKFDLITAVETIYFWKDLPECFKEVHRVLKKGGRFAIMIEVVEDDSIWKDVVEGMKVYSPEQILILLNEAGFTLTEVHRKKPSNVTIIGVKA